MRNTLIIVLMLVLTIPAFGQKKGKKVTPVAISPGASLHDLYSGTLPYDDDTAYTFLDLEHIPGANYGTFSIDETFTKPGGRNLSFKTTGTWTTQISPEDANAVIVELACTEKILFFLRREDSGLQKLDPTMHVMEPESIYILRPHKVVAPKAKKDTITEREATLRRLSGTYKGKLPCADCSGVLTTLSLRYKMHAKTGEYTLSDKYLGTTRGDITNERKGQWHFESRLIEADHKSTVIVLDPNKPGLETYFFIQKNGNIVQLDKNLKPFSTPGDRTLKKQ